MTILELYDRAEQQGVVILEVSTREIDAAAFEDGYIFLDPSKFKSEVEIKCAVAHELGHWETGSFYNYLTPFETWERCEHKANKRAVEILMPLDEVRRALHKGHNTALTLARYFEVTQEFAEMALDMYEADIIHDSEQEQLNAVLAAIQPRQTVSAHKLPPLKKARDLVLKPVLRTSVALDDWRNEPYFKLRLYDEPY